MVVPIYGIFGGQEAGRKNLLLPDRIGPGERKPRIVSQQYLGSADEIAQRLSEAGPGEPDRSSHLAFGDIAAVWGMLDRLGVVAVIDDVVGSRRSDAAASVGTYI